MKPAPKKKPRTLEMEIKDRVRRGKAPPCAVCLKGGTIAGGQIGPVFCNSCGAQYQSLANSWKCALRRSMEIGDNWWTT